MIENFFVKNLNKRGGLLLAKKLFSKTVLEIKNLRKKYSILCILQTSLKNIQPKIKFKNKKISGVVYKIPVPYKTENNLSVSSKWLVSTILNQKPSESFSQRYSKEIIDTFENKSETLKKKKKFIV